MFELLQKRNGFFAFEKSLHVFGIGNTIHTKYGYNLSYWNDSNSWKGHYDLQTADILFFAEDIFGCQFGIRGRTIYRFDPETGDIEEMSSSLDEWAGMILADCKAETGWPLAREWQSVNATLPSNMRLVPKKLFVMGGDYVLENLYALDAVEGMRFRAHIAQQIRKVPDGTRIRLV